MTLERGRHADGNEMEGKLEKRGENSFPSPKSARHADGNPGREKPAMVKPRADAAAAASLAATDALPAPNQGTTAGARKRKAPATEKAPRKPRKRQVEEPIQIPVYYGCRKEDSFSVHGDDLIQDCPAIYADNICAHIVGELPLQPQSMSLVDLQLWVFKLFRLHPETQDLHIKGFLKQRKNDPYNEEDPDWYLEYYQWDTHEFYSDKYWRSFANKLKKKRNVTQKFMLYVESSEIRHYDILLKAVNDDYSQQVPVVLPGTESLSNCEFRFRYLKEHLAVTAEEMAVYLTRHYGEQVTPSEAWRARQMALEKEFGTFYDSYNFAPRLLKEISRKNSGGFVDIKDAEVAGCKDFRVLQRIFWVFGQCLQAFGACRPVLCIKGAPLCGKYQGVLLTAVALDANGFSIPVAFAITECETKESWLWFLRNLGRAVVDQPDACIIHDYKKELIDAVADLLNSRRRQGLKAESRWCMEHLAENFYAYFGDKNLVMMFKKLCQQKQQHKFDKLWKELDELTSKYMAEKECGASEEVQQGSVKHNETELQEQSPSSQPDSVEDGMEGDHADDSKGKITKFSDWIRLKPMDKWSLVHDSNGARYGIMGTDIIDVYKNDPVLKGITCLPLSAIVEVTFLRLEVYFKNTSAAANKAIGNPSVSFPERIQDGMNSKVQKAEMHQVLGGEEALKFTVKLRQRQVAVNMKSEYTHNMGKSKGSTTRKTATCSCNKPQLLHKPCSHVIAVCCHIGLSTAEYMSPYYSLTCLGRTWSKKFNEFPCNYRKKIPRYYRDIRPFERETPIWIPDKRLERGLPVYLLSDTVQTAVVDEEQPCTTEDESVADNEATKTH